MAEFRAGLNRTNGKPLHTLILTDGKMGDLAQCRGVANALGAPIDEIVVKPGKIAAMLARTGKDPNFEEALAAIDIAPNVVLASGRRAAPYLKTMKAQWGHETLTVFLKDPRTGASAADLIWVPTHDALRGSNVITTHTGPHGHTAQRRAKAGSALRAQLARYPRPWLGVLLGGATKKVKYEQATIDGLIQAVATAGKNAGSILITPSRRTPMELTEALGTVHRHTWVWDGNPLADSLANPYPGMLGACDAFIVTGDSHNMVSEALSAGKHTMVFRPTGLPKKFTRFLDSMESEGAITPPGTAQFDRTQDSIDATSFIASAITERLKRRA
ncbi:MAG: mitochondrial fission ELM1 family protein [Pseudomonadota bacterium]